MSAERGTKARAANHISKLSIDSGVVSPEPKLDIGAIRAQILRNAQASILMNIVRIQREGSSIRNPPFPVIKTYQEDGGIRAAVVSSVSSDLGGEPCMTTLFSGSPAESHAEALLSLYENSRKMTTYVKAVLILKELWAKDWRCRLERPSASALRESVKLPSAGSK